MKIKSKIKPVAEHIQVFKMAKDRMADLVRLMEEDTVPIGPSRFQSSVQKEKYQKSCRMNNLLQKISRVWAGTQTLEKLARTAWSCGKSESATAGLKLCSKTELFNNASCFIDQARYVLSILCELGQNHEEVALAICHIAEKHMVKAHCRALYQLLHQILTNLFSSIGGDEDEGDSEIYSARVSKTADPPKAALQEPKLASGVSGIEDHSKDASAVLIEPLKNLAFSGFRVLELSNNITLSSAEPAQRSQTSPACENGRQPSGPWSLHASNLCADFDKIIALSAGEKICTSELYLGAEQQAVLKELFLKVTLYLEQEGPALDVIEHHVTQAPKVPLKRAKPYKGRGIFAMRLRPFRLSTKNKI